MVRGGAVCLFLHRDGALSRPAATCEPLVSLGLGLRGGWRRDDGLTTCDTRLNHETREDMSEPRTEDRK